MARWATLLKSLLPPGMGASLSLFRRVRGWLKHLPAGQVEDLLLHARESGIENVLHLLKVVEIDHGHRLSARTGTPQDAGGKPLPWFTYPAIAYLEQLNLSDLNVFEFGSGAGTLYFGRRAREVFSVDRDAAWFQRVGAAAPANVRLLHHPERDDYVNALADAGMAFDLIVIDGAWRRQCAQAALEHLSPQGWIILDNSDWFPRTAADLRAADLIQVDFSGLGPVNAYTWTTTFFLRRQVKMKPRDSIQPVPGPGSLVQRGEE